MVNILLHNTIVIMQLLRRYNLVSSTEDFDEKKERIEILSMENALH